MVEALVMQFKNEEVTSIALELDYRNGSQKTVAPSGTAVFAMVVFEI